MFNMIKNSVSNEINEEDNKILDKKFNLYLKTGLSLKKNLLIINKKKMENNFSNIMSQFKTFKYNLSSIDKKRILLILNQIEAENSINQINISDKKMEI